MEWKLGLISSPHFNLVAEPWLLLLRYCLHRVTHRMTSRASSREGVSLNVTPLHLRLQPYLLQLAPPPFA